MGTSTAIGKAEVSSSIEWPASHQTGPHVSLTYYSLSGFPISSSCPTIPSTTGRHNPTNGCASTLSPSNWQVATTTSKCYIFPWHSTLYLSPGLINYEPTPSVLGDSFIANSMKFFAVSSLTQVPETSLELANRNQMKPSINIITALLKYKPKSLISHTGR